MLKRVGEVDKIFLVNTNLIYNQVSDNANTGNIRKLFFFNQLLL